MTIKLSFLETFIKIVEYGSFSKTARNLNISQSAISQQMEVLENFFRAKLFKRNMKGVTLTEEGKILLKYAKNILGSIKIAQIEISQKNKELKGSLRISSSTIPGEHILPKYTIKFKQKHPSINFQIEVNDSDISLLKLTNDYVDLAAVGSLKEKDEFETIELAEEDLVLAVPTGHDLAAKETVDLKEILQYNYVTREKTSGTRRESEKIMKEAGISPEKLRIVGELNTTESVLTAVAEGLGISLVSAIAAEKVEKTGLIKCLKLPETITAKRKLFLVKKRTESTLQNKLLEEFWEFVKKK
ncbi:MAG: selenium metabolism-associated LysR family transcriptional regulator [Candidatus Helarchaeota archaeon]